MRLLDKTALVTGAGSGIGRAIAVLMARAGADIVVNGRDMDKLNETARLVSAEGRSALPVSADVTDQAAVDEMVEAAISRFGKIDILVHNAGISGVQSFHDMSAACFDEMVRNHLYGLFHSCRAVVPHMKARRYGRIIAIASASALKGDAMLVHYDAAKAGQIGLIRGLARELIAEGITANVVAPGLTMTPILANVNADIIKAYTPPIGFIADPDDQAHAVVYFASDEARYVTGQVLVPDGGAT